MNILVMSDSHQSVQPIRQLLALYGKQVSAVVHLGDHAADLLQFRPDYPALTMRAVTGNCDYGASEASECIFTVEGKKILLTHGHRHNVKFGYDRLAYYAEEREADACLFGHTHTPAVFDRGGVFFLNPGSVSQPRMGGRAAYGLLSVSDEGIIRGTILYI